MRNFSWLLAAALFAVGCTEGTNDTGETDTSDTGDEWYDGPWQISSVTYDCTTGTPDTWSFDVMTDGLAGGIDLDWYNSGDCHWVEFEAQTEISGCEIRAYTDADPDAVWEETHTFDDNVDWDDQTGAWDHWALELDDVATTGEVVSGETTLFECAFQTEVNTGTSGDPDWEDGSLAYMLTMFDDNGDDLDCVIWGYQSQQYFNTYQSNSCLCFEQDCTN